MSGVPVATREAESSETDAGIDAEYLTLARVTIGISMMYLQLKNKGPDEPGLSGRLAASHIHIAHTAHATTAHADTATLLVLGQFGHHRVGREHQSRD